MVFDIAPVGFRGFTAPASLKLPGVWRVDVDRRGFPGLYRPGLIEAGGGQASTGAVRCGFRGFTAPASLKLLPLGHGNHVRPRRFRGFTAPASLKQLRFRPRERRFLRFRGFTAPASLKRQ